MEAASVLDDCIGQLGGAPTARTAAARYNRTWKPQLDAVSWMREKMLFENRLHTLRANLTMRCGLNVIGQAKSSQVSYSRVQAQAKRYGRCGRDHAPVTQQSSPCTAEHR